MIADIVAQIRAFRPVTGGYGDLLAGALAEAQWETPRYFAAISALLSQGTNVMWWGVIDGCTVVLKRRMTLGTPVIYAVLPPVHPTGNRVAEGTVITALQQCGVPTKLTAEDARNYGYGMGELQKDGRNAEYVYCDLPADRAGWRFRNVRQKMAELHVKGDIAIRGGWDPAGSLIADMIPLAHRWRPRQGDYKGAEKLLGHWANLRHPHFASVIYARSADRERVVAYSLIEQTGPRRGSIVARVQDYEFRTIPHLALALHILDVESFDPRWMLNFGAGFRTAGLDDHKQRLGPYAHVQIYTLKTPRKLTVEDYRVMDPRR